MDAPTDVRISHNAAEHQFEIHDGDLRIGKAEYATVEGGRVFFHTEVDDAYSGQGLAGDLVRQALDETVQAGIRFVAVCPYVAAYVRRHPEYAQHLDTTSPAHRDAVRARGGDA